jgi:hypothetical protein
MCFAASFVGSPPHNRSGLWQIPLMMSLPTAIRIERPTAELFRVVGVSSIVDTIVSSRRSMPAANTRHNAFTANDLS